MMSEKNDAASITPAAKLQESVLQTLRDLSDQQNRDCAEPCRETGRRVCEAPMRINDPST
jgi:hypothetical protein